MKKLFYLFAVSGLLLLCFFMCNITIIGLTNDYDKLSDEQKEIISHFENNTELINGRIYEINATQLKDLIKKHDKAMVYVFTNGCTSEYCKPLNYYVNYAQKNNYKLFLVMTGYGNLEQTINQGIESPLFSIDSKYYQTNIRANYIQYFENDLLNKDKDDSSEYKGSIYIFEKGKFKKVLEKI